MTVFKNYFRIVNRHKVMLLMYSAIFLVLIVVFSVSKTPSAGEYQSVKLKVSIQNENEGELSKALENYLSKSMEIVENSNEDELFYGIIDALITIDSDFEENRIVHFKSAPKSMSGLMVTQRVNEFLNKVGMYERVGLSLSDSISSSLEDLDHEVSVSTISKTETNGAHNYFNFLHYVLMSQIVLIINSVMVIYKKETISKRNEVSPVSKASQNLQLTLGHIVVGVGAWLIYIVMYILLYKNHETLPYYILNSFVFMISVVTLAILLSRIVTNENTLSAIMNVVSLGASFISGAFVPQELLSKFTLNLSKFLPSYYYITNNNQLGFNPSLSIILPNVLIMLAFSIGFIILSNIIKVRR
jgi:ABC-2 type transport system permease protein